MSRLDVMMLALGWVLVIEGFTPMVARASGRSR